MHARECWLFDLGVQEYSQIWALQQNLVARRAGNEVPDSIIFVVHPHVITLGRKRSRLPQPAPELPPNIPIFEIERGGEATYHGPGQLVGYPIIKLEGDRRNLHKYLRSLEEVLIQALLGFGLSATRREGATGVWIDKKPPKKIASIGIAVKQWVTYHGFALNINTDMRHFSYIQPCGFDSSVMTSMQTELGKVIAMTEAKESVAASFGREFRTTLVEQSPSSVLT